MGFRRCTVRGRLTGDIWQFGFVLQSDEDLQIMADAVADAVDGYLTTCLGDYPSSVVWDDVVAAELETGTGRVTETTTAALSVASTGSQAAWPGQVATCVSIAPITGTTHGRFYLPPMGTGQIDSTGALGSTIRTKHVNALKTLFDTMSARTSPARLGIWRTTSQSFIGARAVSIGSVLDTQRRRRNKRIESRTSAVLAL
jgi:hypothetical protein